MTILNAFQTLKPKVENPPPLAKPAKDHPRKRGADVILSRQTVRPGLLHPPKEEN